MSRGSSSSQRTLVPWRSWWGRRRGSHRWVTPCCSPLAAHRGTCSPTTEPAATPSPKPYTDWGDRVTSIAGQPEGRKNNERAWVAAIRDVLDRPLTSYHIVPGATGLLLVLGLMMVLSASSVLSLRVNGNSYTIFVRQLIWVG